MTGRPTVVFIESNTTGTGRLLGELAEAKGLKTVYVVKDPDKYDFLRGRFDFAQAETTDVDAVATAIDRLAQEGATIVGVTSTSEYFIACAARVARRRALPGPDPEAIARARDKFRVRELLTSEDLSKVGFGLAHSADEAVRLRDSLGVRCIVKPRSASGSAGVRLVRDADETRSAFEGVARLLEERGTTAAAEGVLVESYVDAPEYSVEVWDGRSIGITQKHLAAPPHFVEAGHDFPAPIDPALAEAITRYTERVVGALGLTFGAVHVEVRANERDVWLIEANPRLAGGMIPRLIALATGIDLLAAVLDRCLGHAPHVEADRARSASIRFVIPEATGSIHPPADPESLRSVPGVHDVGVYITGQTAVRPRGDFRDRVGHVITCMDSHDEASRVADSLSKRLRDAMSRSVDATHAPEDTGLIKSFLAPEIRAIVFGVIDEHAVTAELEHTALVDLAHLRMLAERGVVPEESVRRLRATILQLLATRFAPLRGREAPRGTYLSYESHLIETLGADVGGILQTGRSRNDLSATVLRLRLRESYASLVASACTVSERFLARAAAGARLPMPAYTHYQTAFPSTFGHYLGACATSLVAEAEDLEQAFADIDRSPLGAGAGGGTSIPIDAELTAGLLGFTSVAKSSIEAVASRDIVFKVLSAASLVAVTLSRFSADVALWTTNEFGLARLPDELVGSSSNMPQKRNPFLLEHVKGKCAGILAASHAALSCAQWVPFGNSVAVGTEATKHLWTGCRQLEELLTIVGAVVSQLEISPSRGRQLLLDGHADAGLEAESLVLLESMPFRNAHHLVGERIAQAESARRSLPGVQSRTPSHKLESPDGSTDTLDMAARLKFGGGAGAWLDAEPLTELADRIARIRRRRTEKVERWRDARDALLERGPSLAQATT